MDDDGTGNLCDDNTDGDGAPNDTGNPGTDDPDDDNDGLTDGSDTSPLDPDRDDDGIIDGLDPDPDTPSNNNACQNLDGPLDTVSFMQEVTDDQICAATVKITTADPARVEMLDGNLLFIAPTVEITHSQKVISVQPVHHYRYHASNLVSGAFFGVFSTK